MSGDQRWEHRVWTRKGEGGLAGRAARSPLTLLSGVYNFGVQVRLAGYRMGLISRFRPEARVISVGNLTVAPVASVNVLQNFCASSQETISTGRFAPRKLLRFEPTIAHHMHYGDVAQLG